MQHSYSPTMAQTQRRVAFGTSSRFHEYTDDDSSEDEEERLIREEEEEERALSKRFGEAGEAPTKKKREKTDEEIEAEYARKKKKPRPTLTPAQVIGPMGLVRIKNEFGSVKYPRKSSSNNIAAAASYSRNLVRAYKNFCYDLFPSMAFEDVLTKIESFGSKKELKSYLQTMRDDVRQRHLEQLYGEEKAERMLRELEHGLRQQQEFLDEPQEVENPYGRGQHLQDRRASLRSHSQFTGNDQDDSDEEETTLQEEEPEKTDAVYNDTTEKIDSNSSKTQQADSQDTSHGNKESETPTEASELGKEGNGMPTDPISMEQETEEHATKPDEMSAKDTDTNKNGHEATVAVTGSETSKGANQVIGPHEKVFADAPEEKETTDEPESSPTVTLGKGQEEVNTSDIEPLEVTTVDATGSQAETQTVTPPVNRGNMEILEVANEGPNDQSGSPVVEEEKDNNLETFSGRQETPETNMDNTIHDKETSLEIPQPSSTKDNASGKEACSETKTIVSTSLSTVGDDNMDSDASHTMDPTESVSLLSNVEEPSIGIEETPTVIATEPTQEELDLENAPFKVPNPEHLSEASEVATIIPTMTCETNMEATLKSQTDNDGEVVVQNSSTHAIEASAHQHLSETIEVSTIIPTMTCETNVDVESNESSDSG